MPAIVGNRKAPGYPVTTTTSHAKWSWEVSISRPRCGRSGNSGEVLIWIPLPLLGWMDPEYLDRNYAGIFIIWDRLFGTFRPEFFRPHYGLTKPVNTFNIWMLQQIIGPLGWEPAPSDLDLSKNRPKFAHNSTLEAAVLIPWM